MKAIPERKPLKIEYASRKHADESEPMEIAIENWAKGIRAQFRYVSDLCFFLGISRKSFDKFMAGKHKANAVWHIVPFEEWVQARIEQKERDAEAPLSDKNNNII